MSANAQALNNAMEVLGSYFGAVSRAEFMYRALAGDTGDGADPTTSSSDQATANKTIIPAAGQACQRILDIVDGGLYCSEILETCQPTGSTETSLWDGMEDADKDLTRAAFTIVGGEASVSDPIGFTASTKIAETLGDSGASVNKSKIPSDAEPGLASFQINDPVLNFANRDSGAVQLFMNGIPTVEFSRCIPYVNMQLIQKGPPVDADGIPQGISLFRFINGQTVTGEGSVDRMLAEAQPIEIAAINAEAAAPPAPGEEPETAPAQFSSAGMEVFTQPQTMLPVDAMGQVPQYASYDEMGAMMQDGSAPDGLEFAGEPGTSRAAPIIDIMRPFMTLTDIKVNIKPTRGPMSMKTGVISLVLHDRSRLSEIAALVKPSAFGSTEILLEWGWSHPDGQLPQSGQIPAGSSMENPYGMFLNSLKTKEKFTCYNSKYSFEQDGQVKISLNVVSKGGDNTASLDIGMTPEIQAKWLITEKLIETVRELRKKIWADEGLRDIIGDQVVASVSPSNVNDMINGDKANDLTKWINQNKKGEGAIGDLATKYGEIKEGGAAAKKSIAAVIKEKTSTAYSTKDPWLHSQDDKGNKNEDPISQAPEVSSPCSFGKLAMLFIGLPIAASGRFDEVQLFFYPFNVNSSYMSGKTIGNFPITKKEFSLAMDELKKKYVQININQWFSTVNSMILKSMASKAYGFGKLYTRDKDGKTTQSNTAKRKGASYLATEKDKVLQTVYGEGADTIFKQPLIKMYTECVPHRGTADPEAPGESNTILRLHFVDTQATSYSSYGDLISAKRNNDIAALSTAVATFNKSDPCAERWEKLSKAAQDAPEAANLYQPSQDGKYVFIKGGAAAVKYFVKTSMPHINYGSAASAVLKANIQTMSDSKNSTIHMIRAQAAGNSDQGTPGDQDRGLPARMMPMQLSMEVIGCPLINFMQQFFIDFGTGTSVDNIYAVTNVDHIISPGKFITKLKFVPLDAYGKYESLSSNIDKAISIANEG
jgi:hypothetical protein